MASGCRLVVMAATAVLGALIGCAAPPPPEAPPVLAADPAGTGPSALEPSPFEVGATLIRDKRWEDAKPHLQKAIELEPNKVEAHYLLAVAQHETGDNARAEAGLTKALKLDPTLEAATERLAAIYLTDPARPQLAIPMLQTLVERHPDRPHLRAELGRAFGMQGDVDRAKEHYEASLAKDNRVAVRIAYGALLIKHQRRPEGREQLSRALESTGDDASLLVALGRAFEDAGYHSDCVRALDRAVASKPKDAVVYLRRGDCRRGARDGAGAVADYRSAVALDPQSAEAHLRLGDFLAESAKTRTEGIASLELAAKLDPNGSAGKRAATALAKARAR